MSLLYSNLAVASEPGIHAFVVGIADYPNLLGQEYTPERLQRVTNAARAFCGWLIDHRLDLEIPLSSVELLLSEPNLAQAQFQRTPIERCTKNNLTGALYGWRDRVSAHTEGIALFYWCGLAMQVSRSDFLLLLSDFGAGSFPMLEGAVEFRGIYNGMAFGRNARDVARKQFYFLDLWSIRPDRYPIEGQPPRIFPVQIGEEDWRDAPVIIGKNQGFSTEAYEPGSFTEALLAGLDGAAATPAPFEHKTTLWVVSTISLASYVTANRGVTIDNLSGDTVIRSLAKAPPGKELFFDRRSELTGPALHALIIGVSSYPHSEAKDPIPLQSLEGPALTAARMANWLRKNSDILGVPLATIRLLISPSELEGQWVEMMGIRSEHAILDKVLVAAAHWRDDAAVRKEDMTLFYFAGHGARREYDDTVFLLENINDGIGGLLRNAIDLRTLLGGMAPSSLLAQISRTQLYFVDACRVDPEEFRRYERLATTPVFSLSVGGVDDRQRPIFYAALPGSSAFCRQGCGTIFGEALLESLAVAFDRSDGRAAITVRSLDDEMQLRISDVNTRTLNPLGLKQEYILDGQHRNPVILWGKDDAGH